MGNQQGAASRIVPTKREGTRMKSTLFGFGVVFLIGAVWFTLGTGPMQTMKNLTVLVFLFPGIVALVVGLEITRLQNELRKLRAHEKTPRPL
jgi:biotin transporter BioY